MPTRSWPPVSPKPETASVRPAQSGPAWLPARSLVTEASLRTDLANARQQIRRLTEEITLLRARLSRDLGADADISRGRAASPLLDQLEARTAELADDNAQLRQQAARLEAESQELTETLTAAREMNRDLMNQVNRPPRTPATQSPPVAKRHRS